MTPSSTAEPVDRPEAQPPGRESFRRLVENLPAGAVYLDGELLYCNRAAGEITGYPCGEQGTLDDWFARLFPGRTEEVRALYEADRKAGFPKRRVVPLIRPDGEERLVEFAGYADAQGELWLLRDITESARMTRLMEQTARAAEVGGWEIDIASMRLFWTEGTYRIHDTTPAEYSPSVETAISFYAPESIPIITEAVRRGFEQGRAFDLELELITAKHRRIWVRSVGVAEVQGGKTVKLYGAFQDISKRRAADLEREEFQRNLLQTQKLESLGVLAGGIAHDFNNLLTGVMGHNELVRMITPANSPALAYLAEIDRAAQRAAELCRQMLAYAGKGRFVVEPVDLSALVSDTAKLLKLSVSKKATLTMRLAEGLPPIRGDITQLRQVLMNLVINASESLKDQEGLIAISTGPEEKGGLVYLEVRDTGCGMDESTRTRIFEPFFTTKFTGRGLGLSAVQGIVRGHDGELNVRSSPGHGSTFRLSFPPARGGGAAPRVEEALGDYRGEGLVLLVDDEEPIRAAASELLATFGFEVAVASDGWEAVQVMQQRVGKVRLVLLDLTMPRLDGEQTLVGLRAIDPGVRVVLMSGYSERELSERFAGKGLAGFLQKPFSREQLGAKVRDALAG